MKRITDYFGKEPEAKRTCETSEYQGRGPSGHIRETNVPPSSSASTSLPCLFRPPENASNPCQSVSSIPDIGLAGNLTLSERLKLLETPWVAPEGFQWPFTERKQGDKIRRKYLSSKHFQGLYDVFAFSLARGGIFCKVCALFSPDVVGGVDLGALVKRPLVKYSLLKGKSGSLTKHLLCGYHEDAVIKAEHFKNAMKTGDVSQQLQTEFAVQREKNRKTVMCILRAVEFLGRMGLALRGHRDCGQVQLDAEQYSEGNFRAVLQLMVESGDVQLEEHIRNARKNATYMSSQSQNELINSCFNVLKKEVVQEVNDARYFTLLADATTDAAHLEQLSICVRYIGRDEEVKERLLQFDIAPKVTGAALAEQLLNILGQSGIHLKYLVGQAYDGAANMSGCEKGVYRHILRLHPSASYVHCSNHCLNLVLVKSCKIPEIKACKTAVNMVAVFLTESSKRSLILSDNIDQHCQGATHQRLKRTCATRWVEDQVAFEVFDELYPAIVPALITVVDADDQASGEAAMLLKAIEDPGFLIALQVLRLVLSVTRPLSQVLQKKTNDLLTAIASVDECISVLRAYRDDDRWFSELFEQATHRYGAEIPMPRTTQRQIHRNNVPAAAPKQYFHRAIFLPFLDSCMFHMKEQFKEHHAQSFRLAGLIPATSSARPFRDIEEGVNFYLPFLPCGVEDVKAEYLRWQHYWLRCEQRIPDNPIEALREASRLGTYPAILELLRIFATLPVTTATCERSFSAMKYLKSYLRTSMGEERMNGLALLYVNRDIPLDYNAVIDDFAKVNRRLAL